MSPDLFLGFIGAMLLAVGGLCLTIAWRARQREQLTMHALSRATGTIVKLKKERRGDDDYPRSYPVVEFTTSSGERATMTSSYPNHDRSAQQVGDSVEVQYDPRDPAHAEIAGAAGRSYVIIAVSGAVVLLLGVMLITTVLGR